MLTNQDFTLFHDAKEGTKRLFTNSQGSHLTGKITFSSIAKSRLRMKVRNSTELFPQNSEKTITHQIKISSLLVGTSSDYMIDQSQVS